MNLSDRLRLAMVEADNISQSELARACGVKPSAINMLLSGQSKTMSVAVLFRAARALRVNAEWLGVGAGPMRGQAQSLPPLIEEVARSIANLPEDELAVLRHRLLGAVAEWHLDRPSRRRDIK